ncbi:MAG: NUDIX domain-containing protein [Bacteroidota bacterium]
MDRNQLLKILLPGLLPLIVFILVDEFYGTTAGLIVAVAFGIGQLLLTYIKDKVFDTFVLFDTLLIVVLGGISLLLDNDIFFKLKPAIVGSILCVMLGVSSFSSMNLVVMMSKRYLKGIEINDAQVQQLTRSAKILFYLFSFHTLLVIYSAFLMSTEAWAFISTILFYLLFGVYFLYELVNNKIALRRFQKEEWLPLVDEKGMVTGKAPRSVVHKNKEMLHPVVHLHVINERKELFLQKRSMTKAAEPGKWDTSVGGHVALGETVETALQREAEEELGLKNVNIVPFGHYVYRGANESELVFVFTVQYSGEMTIDKNEIDEGRFWTTSEIDRNIPNGIFTPSLLIEYDLLRKQKII